MRRSRYLIAHGVGTGFHKVPAVPDRLIEQGDGLCRENEALLGTPNNHGAMS